MRITNAAIGSTPFDAYVTAPGVSLDGISPNLSNVAAGTTSTFVILSAGQYQVRFTLHNSKQLIYDAGTLTFAGNMSYAFVAYSKASGTLVNAALLVMDTNGNGALANSTISEFKLVHAAPLTAAINARGQRQRRVRQRPVPGNHELWNAGRRHADRHDRGRGDARAP